MNYIFDAIINFWNGLCGIWDTYKAWLKIGWDYFCNSLNDVVIFLCQLLNSIYNVFHQLNDFILNKIVYSNVPIIPEFFTDSINVLNSIFPVDIFFNYLILWLTIYAVIIPIKFAIKIFTLGHIN